MSVQPTLSLARRCVLTGVATVFACATLLAQNPPAKKEVEASEKTREALFLLF